MIAMMGAFDETAIEMLGMFTEMTAPLIVDLRKKHNLEHIAAVAEIAHSLKGAARSACCPKLGDLAARLQDEAETGSYHASLIDEIAAEFKRVEIEVSAFE